MGLGGGEVGGYYAADSSQEYIHLVVFNIDS